MRLIAGISTAKRKVRKVLGSGLSLRAVYRRPMKPSCWRKTVEDLLENLRGNERTIVGLTLQGYSTPEISQQTGRAERSVRRVREQVRRKLNAYRPKRRLTSDI